MNDHHTKRPDDVRALAEAVAAHDEVRARLDCDPNHRPMGEALRYALAAALPGWLAERGGGGLDAAAEACVAQCKAAGSVVFPAADSFRRTLAPHWPGEPVTPADELPRDALGELRRLCEEAKALGLNPLGTPNECDSATAVASFAIEVLGILDELAPQQPGEPSGDPGQLPEPFGDPEVLAGFTEAEIQRLAEDCWADMTRASMAADFAAYNPCPTCGAQISDGACSDASCPSVAGPDDAASEWPAKWQGLQRAVSAAEEAKQHDWVCTFCDKRFPDDVAPCPHCFPDGDTAPVDILDRARQLVDGDRQAQYGDPVEAHEAIAEIMAVLGGISSAPNDAEFEAVGMIVRKLVRRMAGAEPVEAYTDLIGYAVIAERCSRR